VVDFSACSGFSVVRFFRICHAVCSIIAKLALANNALITIVAAPNVKRGIAVNASAMRNNIKMSGGGSQTLNFVRK
jgi:hypothetical protein